MNHRGEYGHARRPQWSAAFVGALQQSESDQAVAQIDAEMEAILDATYRAMGVDPTVLRRPATADAIWLQRVRDAKAKAMTSPLWAFWEGTVSPKYEDWKANFKTLRAAPLASWEDYQLWLGRVRQLRADVQTKGIKLTTPDLADLSAVSVTSTASTLDMSKILKWGAIGALAIGGLVALSALAASTKSAREPYERYRWGYLSAR